MAEFREVLKQWSRMCEKHICNKRDKSEQILPVCPLVTNHFGHLCDDAVTDLSQESVAQIEEIVMSWAAEHPEPKYPTWYRWLIMMGAIGSVEDLFSDLQREIPADIAEQLGLSRMEG